MADEVYRLASCLHFGLGYKGHLPEGWKLEESETDFALGIAPDGQKYFLGEHQAYPRRVAGVASGNLKAGEVYMDTESGVIDLPARAKVEML